MNKIRKIKQDRSSTKQEVKLKCPECGKVVVCRTIPIDGWYAEQLMHMREVHGSRY